MLDCALQIYHHRYSISADDRACYSPAGSTGAVTEEDRQEAAWAASLCHRLRQTRRQGGVFHWRKRLRFSAVCYRQGKRFSWYGAPCAGETQTIAPRSRLYAGISAVFIPAVWITSTLIPSAVSPNEIWSLMVIGYPNWWWVEAERTVRCRGYWAPCFLCLSSAEEGSQIVWMLFPLVSFKCAARAAVQGRKSRCYRWIFTESWWDLF